jgi:hypothetical protein
LDDVIAAEAGSLVRNFIILDELGIAAT